VDLADVGVFFAMWGLNSVACGPAAFGISDYPLEPSLVCGGFYQLIDTFLTSDNLTVLRFPAVVAVFGTEVIDLFLITFIITNPRGSPLGAVARAITGAVARASTRASTRAVVSIISFTSRAAT
jgi:hypothetical protein